MKSWICRKICGVVSVRVSSGTKPKKWEKKSHLVENHQENGVARDLDRTLSGRKTIAEYAKDRKSDVKKFDVAC